MRKRNSAEFWKSLEELQIKLRPWFKKVEKNPRLMVCELHKATKKEVKRLRKDHSWRAVAYATSHGLCSNQLCGQYLCRYAGADENLQEEKNRAQAKRL
ncbi:hypothetical protein HY489_00885 [Candidatus Woesearchaeota archaeon]|nr:hypothetical protein [Candidatus Woesearchaeota archaeon]